MPRNPRAAFLSEFLKFHLAGVKQPDHSVAKQFRVVGAIEEPFKFVDVGLQMFRTDLMMIRTNYAALEQAPHALDGVRMNVNTCRLLHIFTDGSVPTQT